MADFIPIQSFQDASASSLQTSRLADLQRQSAVKSGEPLTDAKKAEYQKAAKGFESMFINMMMKQMRTSMLEEKKPGEESMSFGADTLQGFTDLQFADYAVTQGGTGLASQIYQHLTGEKLPTVTQTTGVNSSLPQSDKPMLDLSGAKSKISAPLQQKGNFIDKVTSRLKPFEKTISQAAQTHNVPVSLIKGVIAAESAGKSTAQSAAGAKGLMQLMDATAGDLGVDNSFDASQNIAGGVKYLDMMLKKFDGNVENALAAYNAGAGNVQKYNGIPPFKETQSYVRNVLRYASQFEEDNLA